MPRVRQLFTRCSDSPNKVASSLCPPAASMSFVATLGSLDSVSVMVLDSTQGVYRKSNKACTTPVHKAFRVGPMKKEPNRLTLHIFKLAKELKKWEPLDFANKIGSNKQDVWNWKDRGFPSAKYAIAADKIGVSLDELLDKAPLAARSQNAAVDDYDMLVGENGASFEAEFKKLPRAMQIHISSLVHLMVAEMRRGEMAAKKPKSGPQSPPPRGPRTHQ